MKKKITSIIMVLAFIVSTFAVFSVPSEAKTTTQKITFKFNGKTATVCKVKVSGKSVALKGKIMSQKTYMNMFDKAPSKWGGGSYTYDGPVMKGNREVGLTLLSYYPNKKSSNNYIDFHYEGYEICGIKRGMTEKKAYKKLKKIFGKNNVKKEKVKKNDNIRKFRENYKSVEYRYVVDGSKGNEKKFVLKVSVGKGKVQAVELEAGDYSELAER